MRRRLIWASGGGRPGQTSPAPVASIAGRSLEGPSSPLRHERLAISHANVGFGIGLVLVALSVPGIARLRVQDAWVDNFDPASDLVTAERDFNARFWGSYRLDVVLDGPPEYFYQADGIALMSRVGALAAGGPWVGGVLTYADQLEDLAAALGVPSPVSSPTAGRIADLATVAEMVDPSGLRQLVSGDGSRARARVFVNSADYQRALALQVHLARGLGTLLAASNVGYHFSGELPLAVEMVRAVVTNELRSIGWTLAGIALLLLVALRRAGVVLIVMVPVAVASLIVFAAMGWTGVTLGVASSMFASLAIGVGIDFAVHMHHGYERQRAAGGDHTAALAASMGQVGRALRWNAVVLGLGLLVLAGSSLQPDRRLGILLAAAVFTCYATTLLILPRLLGQLAITPRPPDRSVKTTAVMAVGLVVVLGLGLTGCSPGAPRTTGLPTGGSVGTVETATDSAAGGSVTDQPAAMDLLAGGTVTGAQTVPGLLPGELMRQIEAGFRAGPRAARMDVTDSRTGEAPVQRTIWGLFNGDPTLTRILYVYTTPERMRGTSLLLADDRDENMPDRAWLYLPGMDYFRELRVVDQQLLVPGTALSYEDSRGFIPTDRYVFEYAAGAEASMSSSLVRLIARPVTAAVRANTGYDELLIDIDPARQLVTHVEYTDLNGRPLKEYETLATVDATGLWLPEKIRVEHHVEGIVTEIDYRYWALRQRPAPAVFEPSIDRADFLIRLLGVLDGEGIDIEDY